jgi:hypothetical protein
MIKEVEIDISEFPNDEIIEALKNAIDSKAIKHFHNDEYIKKMEPKIEEMKSKLREISVFVLGYSF